jgi:hypothetical protein
VIERKYAVPEGSDLIPEIAKCVAFRKNALA